MAVRTPLLQALFSEVNRLAAAAGGEGKDTQALEWIRNIDEAVQSLVQAAESLLPAAEWGSDAHPGFEGHIDRAKESLTRAKELLGLGVREERSSEKLKRMFKGTRDIRSLIREVESLLKEARSWLQKEGSREREITTEELRIRVSMRQGQVISLIADLMGASSGLKAALAATISEVGQNLPEEDRKVLSEGMKKADGLYWSVKYVGEELAKLRPGSLLDRKTYNTLVSWTGSYNFKNLLQQVINVVNKHREAIKQASKIEADANNVLKLLPQVREAYDKYETAAYLLSESELAGGTLIIDFEP